jgi:hypothetical protein
LNVFAAGTVALVFQFLTLMTSALDLALVAAAGHVLAGERRGN